MSTTHGYGLLTLALVIGLAAACEKQVEHPPYALIVCDGSNCGPGHASGAGGNGGSGGSLSDATLVDGAAGVDVTGSVVAYSDTSLLSTEIMDLPYTVTFDQGASGVPLVASAAAGGTFTALGVGASSGMWTSVVVGDAAGASSDFLTTWQAVDTLDPTPKTLFVMKSLVLDTIFSSVTPALVRNASAAQIIVQFQDTTGQPLAGVTVDSGPGERTLYSSLSTWTETAAGTDASGYVLLANVVASSGSSTITYSSGTHTGQSVGVENFGGGQVTLVGARALP